MEDGGPVTINKADIDKVASKGPTTTPQLHEESRLAGIKRTNESLFECLSHAVFGHPGSAPEVKKQIEDHVVNNWVNFKALVQAKLNDFHITPMKYRLGNLSAPGGFPEVLAGAELFDSRVDIHNAHDKVITVGRATASEVIHLLQDDRLGGTHYDLIIGSPERTAVPHTVAEAHYAGEASSPSVWAARAAGAPALGAAAAHAGSSYRVWEPGPRPPAPPPPQSQYGESVHLLAGRPGELGQPVGPWSGQGCGIPLHSNKFYVLSEMVESSEESAVECPPKPRASKTPARVQKPRIGKIPIKLKSTGISLVQGSVQGITEEDILTLNSPEWAPGSLSEEDSQNLGVVSTLQISVHLTRTEALLDSGAVVSVIDYQFLKESFPGFRLIKTGKRLKAANKASLKTFGVAFVPVKIGDLQFLVKFYVCKGISYSVILGNTFLRQAKARIDFGQMCVTLYSKKKQIRCTFGTFFEEVVESPETIPDPFAGLDVAEVYSGPKFIKARKAVVIPPKTIQYIQVKITPHPLDSDTLFIGNRRLNEHYKLLVSDFLLKPDGKQFIQVTNASLSHRRITPDMNLAVDEEWENVFSPEVSVISPVGGKPENENKSKFQINPELTPDQFSKAQALLDRFRDVFVSDVSELSVCNYPPVKIAYDDSRVVRKRNYKMSPDQAEFVESYCQKLLDADLVEFCTSVYQTPILTVPKYSPDPSKPQFRWVQDFREINKLLKPIDYPIMSPDQIIDSSFGSKYHSVTDACSGYSQLPLHPSCRDITAFETPSGSKLRWKVLSQGLSVSPALYGVAVDHILQKLKRKRKIGHYFDDIYLATETFDEHLEFLEEYLSILLHYNVQLNINKSTFFQFSVKLLGVQIDGTSVKILDKRIQAITKMSPPTNRDGVHKCLGVFNYNRRFIQNYAAKASPIISLLKKDVPFVWGPEQEQAFQALKSELASPPALRIFNPHANNRISCDASRLGLGCCHYQEDPVTKRWHPVAFESRKLKASEEKLPIYWLEMASLILAFLKFGHHVQNHKVSCEVLTDHQSLRTLLNTKNPTGTLAKYIMFLSQYKFTIKYRKGSLNESDTLSRFPVSEAEETIEELVDQQMFDRVVPQQLHEVVHSLVFAVTRQQVQREGEKEQQLDEWNKFLEDQRLANHSLPSLPDIQQFQKNDPQLVEIFAGLQEDPHSQSPFELHEGTLFFNKRGLLLLVIPVEFQKHILHEFHDLRGHKGLKHTKEAILSKFYWPSLDSDSELYCKSCVYCQLHKRDRLKVGLLNPVIPKGPFTHIGCDFVGKFPISSNKNLHACVFIDYFTRYLYTIPVRTADAVTAVDCLYEFMLRYGVPEHFTSDGASYFNCVTFEAALNKFQIQGRHFRKTPHCNGMVEKSIMEVKRILAQLLLDFGHDWETHLPLATFLYNVSYHDTLKTSPFFALHGYHPLTPGILQLFAPSGSSMDVESKIAAHSDLIKKLQVRIQLAQERNKKYYDKDRVQHSYSVGQLVKVRDETDDMSFPNKQIFWRGPFEVVGITSERFYIVMVEVKLPQGGSRLEAKQYHIKNMRPFHSRPASLQVEDPLREASRVGS